MKHFILFLITLTALLYSEEFEELFPSTPEEIASLSADVDTLIGGVVSPLSGMPLLHVTDLIAKGAQDIALTRTYLSPYMPVQFVHKKGQAGEYEKKYLHEYLAKNYRGWVYLPHILLEYYPFRSEVRLPDPSGMILTFYLLGSDAMLIPDHGISNAMGERPSGRYDLRNTRILFQNDKVLVYSCDSTVRHYKRTRESKEQVLYLLEKEVLPNGKVLKYYIDSGTRIRIESQDPQERYTYATLTIDSTNRKQEVHGSTSSGGHAVHHYVKNNLNWRIKHRKFEEKSTAPLPPLLRSANTPFFASESLSYCGRHLLATYIGKDVQCGLHHDGFGEQRHYRVDKLSLPVGLDNTFIETHTLDYEPAIAGQKAGKTTVKRLDGTSTIYHFSKELLLTCVQSFDQGQLKQERKLTWTTDHLLRSVEVSNGAGQLHYRKTFEYSLFGNPFVERLTGDLTGSGKEETVTTYRRFASDGSNRLIEEEEAGGKTTCLAYLADTHLLTSKLIKMKDRIVQSTFYTYDDAYNLIETIHADESERRITRYVLRQEQPYLHMPEWIIESYEQDGVEKLLEKRHLTYSSTGYIAEEAVYGADGQHAYTLYKTYNERGDILTETNALGDTATYTYDARGRRITETNFSGRLKKEIVYDMRGRKLSTQENTRQTYFTYNAYDRCLSKTDPFGHTTDYAYDPLTSQVTQVALAQRTTNATYDVFGRKITERDANGNLTHYRYNAYNAPVEIIYADGSKESFLYNKQGWLQKHITLDGLTIRYERDAFGRVLKKTYGDVAEERFTYSAFHLLSEADKEGHTTFYFYDGAGRKIREEFCGRVTHFTYDVLNKLATVEVDGLVTHYTRDLAGRICEECKTDTAGKVLYKIGYGYDKDGYRTAIKRYICDEATEYTFSFDPFGRCIAEQDALGAETTKHYDEEHINALGQKVLRVVTTDPLSSIKIDTYDIFAQLLKTEKYDHQGTTLATQENNYDAQGNLLCQQEHVYQDGQYQRTHRINYTYTPVHQVNSCMRDLQRTTQYTYLPSGKMQSKTVSDGTTLHYTYDTLGFLSRIDSSDGVIHHTFTHNRLGALTSAYDANQDLLIQRHVDPFGNVLYESLPSGLSIEKTYDAHNRLTSLILPNGTVEYTYDPLYLRTVTRVAENGQAYTHAFTAYDLDGFLLQESLPGALGTVMHDADVNGLPDSCSSSYFSQRSEHDACGNVINSFEGMSHRKYTYDSLSQLTSEGNAYSYLYDSHFNRTHKNTIPSPVNSLNELREHVYDQNGCQATLNNFTLTYDPLQRLTAAISPSKQIYFTYDPLGRRLSKAVEADAMRQVEYYLYNGDQEIGAYKSDHFCKNMRVCAGQRTLAIELPGRTLVPLHDMQNNIRRLIDLKSHSIADSYDFSAFGEDLQPAAPIDNPWRFASKRYDPDLRLIDFGARFYNPYAGRWLTPDPAGFHDSTNLYQYVFNNPFKYTDPNGKFASVISVPIWGTAVPQMTTGMTTSAALATAAQVAGSAAVAWGAYELEKVQARLDKQALQRDAHINNGENYPAHLNKPPYDGKELGDDPTKCPGEGFEWKGRGPPESGKGSWVKGEDGQKETLYPDLKHPDPIGPHWDYDGPDFPEGARLFPDGSWEIKK